MKLVVLFLAKNSKNIGGKRIEIQASQVYLLINLKSTLKSMVPLPSLSKIRKIWSTKTLALPTGRIMEYMSRILSLPSSPSGQSTCDYFRKRFSNLYSCVNPSKLQEASYFEAFEPFSDFLLVKLCVFLQKFDVFLTQVDSGVGFFASPAALLFVLAGVTGLQIGSHCGSSSLLGEKTSVLLKNVQFQINFSLIKSHFLDESINLNFQLVFRYFENITKAFTAHYCKKTLLRH